MTSIVNNANAINAQRNLNITTMKMGKVLEKLSSGFRINRAADDAAGLGISEKMRAQIRGNSQAIRNANDGISMIQTAEGAMDEVHSILQRMRELGVQAANDTYDTAARDSIATEINQLRTEVDRIANSTQFNGQSLLTGALSGQTGSTITGGTLNVGDQVFESTVGGSVGANLVAGELLGTAANGAAVNAISLENEAARSVNPGALTFGYTAGTNELTLSGTGFTAAVTLSAQAAGNIDFTDATTGATVRVTLGAPAGTFATADNASDDLIGAAFDTQTVALVNDAANAASVSGITTTGTTAAGTFTLTRQSAEVLRISDGTTNQDLNLATLFGGEITGSGATSALNFSGFGLTVNVLNGGATAVDTQSLARDLDGLTITVAAATGSAATLQVGANVTTNDRAQALVHLVDQAITTLNTRRATLGASQNRLESTVNSLGVAVENLTASESRIRDADVAKLSSQLVSQQILQQAGTAMLSQANSGSQSVLGLLR